MRNEIRGRTQSIYSLCNPKNLRALTTVEEPTRADETAVVEAVCEAKETRHRPPHAIRMRPRKQGCGHPLPSSAAPTSQQRDHNGQPAQHLLVRETTCAAAPHSDLEDTETICRPPPLPRIPSGTIGGSEAAATFSPRAPPATLRPPFRQKDDAREKTLSKNAATVASGPPAPNEAVRTRLWPLLPIGRHLHLAPRQQQPRRLPNRVLERSYVHYPARRRDEARRLVAAVRTRASQASGAARASRAGRATQTVRVPKRHESHKLPRAAQAAQSRPSLLEPHKANSQRVVELPVPSRQNA